MADGEHLGPQTRNLWLKDSKTLEGTAKHPQGRLFAPVGSYRGDPMRLHPDNWMKQSATPAHDDIISWHSSEEQTLPRSDEYEHRQHEPGYGTGPDWGDDDEEYGDDFSTDSKDRPMGDYGSVVGMHFGDVKAATERSSRPFVHPARIPSSTLAAPPRGTFSYDKAGGGIIGGPYRSQRMLVNEAGDSAEPDTRWEDSAANYSEKGTDFVEQGKTLAYRNEVEAKGSTSYRTLPETARTWSEDVMSAVSPHTGAPASKYGWGSDQSFRNEPHPALVHLAEKSYDPVVKREDRPSQYNTPVQMTLGDLARSQGSKQTGELGNTDALENIGRVRASDEAQTRIEHFNTGRDWTLRKPEG